MPFLHWWSDCLRYFELNINHIQALSGPSESSPSRLRDSEVKLVEAEYKGIEEPDDELKLRFWSLGALWRSRWRFSDPEEVLLWSFFGCSSVVFYKKIAMYFGWKAFLVLNITWLKDNSSSISIIAFADFVYIITSSSSGSRKYEIFKKMVQYLALNIFVI